MVQEYVSAAQGARYVEARGGGGRAGLAALLADSSPRAPLVLVLSSGTDPAAGTLWLLRELQQAAADFKH